MRFLVELLVVVALIYLGWEIPFRERMPGYVPPETVQEETPPPQVVTRYVPRPATTPSGVWMWNSSNRTALDRPAYNTQDAKPDYRRYLDESGRSYWLDAQGIRHYDP